jgi:F-type H+-transporting ATPase subunit b
VHTASAMVDGAGGVRVLLPATEHTLGGRFVSQTDEPATTADPGPSPITPEGKELLWGLGAFLVLLVVMRLWLVPKLKEGMQRRYGKVLTDLEHAEQMRDAARQEVAQYEAQLAAVRSEATARIDAARDVLDRERTDRINEANAAIAERRSAVAAEAETARIAAASSVEDAAVAVAARLIELSTGRRPDEAVVRRAVADLTSAGART